MQPAPFTTDSSGQLKRTVFERRKDGLFIITLVKMQVTGRLFLFS